MQLFLFQQFLMLFLLTPITGAMALAAHAIVGEKQARTLEPLLATPITTFELLAAKVVGALAPTLAISLIGLVLYFGGILLFAAPGVAAAMASVRTLMLIVLVAPAAALVSLQAAILISSRVNDARTAQQFGVLIIIPLTGVLVAQFTGSFWLSATRARPRRPRPARPLGAARAPQRRRVRARIDPDAMAMTRCAGSRESGPGRE